MAIRRRIDPEEGRLAVQTWAAARDHTGSTVEPATIACAVRYTVEEFASRHPGNAVELRVPPFAAVQAIAGPAHTRGTPPNVVEFTAEAWLLVVTGRSTFADEVAAGRVLASGTRSDLGEHLPLEGVN